MSEISSPSQHIIPLAEYPGLERIVPEYVPPLGIDTKRLDRLKVLGCIDEIGFAVNAGESSTYDTKVVGNLGGVALGGATRLRQPRLSEGGQRNGTAPDQSKMCHDLIPVQININSTGIQERVASDARNPKAWAKHLNTAIGTGIRSAAWMHLTRQPGINEAVWMSMSLAFRVEDYVQGEYGSIFEAYSELLGTSALLGTFAVMCKEVHPKRLCLSAVPVAHVDRALLVSALTRLKPVVRPLDTAASA